MIHNNLQAFIDVLRRNYERPFLYEFPLLIDACMKPGYPDELEPGEDIAQLVDRRWKECLV